MFAGGKNSVLPAKIHNLFVPLLQQFLTMQHYELQDYDFIPLNDLMKKLHLVGTGGEANIRIVNGEVLVNGEEETRKRRKLRAGDVVEFAGERVEIR